MTHCESEPGHNYPQHTGCWVPVNKHSLYAASFVHRTWLCPSCGAAILEPPELLDLWMNINMTYKHVTIFYDYHFIFKAHVEKSILAATDSESGSSAGWRRWGWRWERWRCLHQSPSPSSDEKRRKKEGSRWVYRVKGWMKKLNVMACTGCRAKPIEYFNSVLCLPAFTLWTKFIF